MAIDWSGMAKFYGFISLYVSFVFPWIKIYDVGIPLEDIVFRYEMITENGIQAMQTTFGSLITWMMIISIFLFFGGAISFLIGIFKRKFMMISGCFLVGSVVLWIAALNRIVWLETPSTSVSGVPRQLISMLLRHAIQPGEGVWIALVAALLAIFAYYTSR